MISKSRTTASTLRKFLILALFNRPSMYVRKSSSSFGPANRRMVERMPEHILVLESKGCPGYRRRLAKRLQREKTTYLTSRLIQFLYGRKSGVCSFLKKAAPATVIHNEKLILNKTFLYMISPLIVPYNVDTYFSGICLLNINQVHHIKFNGPTSTLKRGPLQD
jgi:hypothetical protein